MKLDKLKILRFVFFVLAAAIMVLIFCMSAQDGNKSTNTSKGVIVAVATVLNPNFDNMTSVEQSEYISGFQFIVRKLAHFSIYTALGITICSGMLTFSDMWFVGRGGVAFGISVIYAASDEFHQYFVPGRSCELRDVSIDSGGALLGCLAAMGIYFIARRIKHKKI